MEGRTRRQFLKLIALGGTAVMLPTVFTACEAGPESSVTPPTNGVTLDLRTDTGILNYAYALEQLEAAFYSQVVSQFSASDLSSDEKTILTDIRNHEVIHRDAFSALLGSARIPNLTPDFSALSFTQRTTSGGTGILQAAATFEDLGVAAYNGAGRYLSNADYITLAGKIVSVEARHASVLRDLLNPGSADFAGDDVVDANGLDKALAPSAVLSSADPYIETSVSISHQPA
jgi:rubrerythrin